MELTARSHTTERGREKERKGKIGRDTCQEHKEIKMVPQTSASPYIYLIRL